MARPFLYPGSFIWTGRAAPCYPRSMSEKSLFPKHEVLERLRAQRAAGRPIRADYNLACLIASNALLTQTDKGGTDYAHHMHRVSRHHTDSNTRMIIGVLHDVVEDSDWTGDDLRAAGFSERIVSAVEALSHLPGEKYFDSIERLSHNRDAVDVKLKDLRDNMTVSRLTSLPGAADFERLQKYTVAFNYLLEIKRRALPPGTPVGAFVALRPQLDPGAAFWARHSAQPYRPAPQPAP